MAKQKFYAYFFDEKNNGIVDTWTECEKIVQGTKARYKSFPASTYFLFTMEVIG